MENKTIIEKWNENKVILVGYRIENGEIIFQFKENNNHKEE